MIELRWLERKVRGANVVPPPEGMSECWHVHTERVLQYRTWDVTYAPFMAGANMYAGWEIRDETTKPRWTDWQDVPTVTAQEVE